MNRFPSISFRLTVAPCLLAVSLLVSGCESPRLSSLFQGKKVETNKAIPKKEPEKDKAVRAQPAPKTELPSFSTLPRFPYGDEKESTPESQKNVPSLVPFLTGRPAPEPAPTGPMRPSLLPPEDPSSIRVALLLPLTGVNARVGKAMLNAAQMALFEFADDRFELLVHDTGGTEDGASEAATQAVNEGAALILGPLLSGSVRALAPQARAAGVPVLSFSSDSSVSGEGIYTMGFYPGMEVERVVSFAASKKIRRFAALVPDNDYGAAVIKALRGIAEKQGLEIVRIETYDPMTNDFSSIVRALADYDQRRQALLNQRAELKGKDDEISVRALERLKRLQTIGDLPYGALLLAEGGKRLQAIAALLPFYDIDPGKIRMIGTGQWDQSGLGAEPALSGGWYAAPSPGDRKAFEAQYKKVYGSTPPRLATLAYDASALAALLARSGPEKAFSREAITAAVGFSGRDGIFRFLPNGSVERGLAVLQLRAHGARVIGPAPRAFSGLQ